ncbi:MAG: hypothetical protein FWE24_09135 [Defluviitaleaceae bacterium]|nr:hypothetical protein [Defluviitaleaceae bacterium]
MRLSDMKFGEMMKVVATIAAEAAPLLEDDEIMGLSKGFKPLLDESDADYEWRFNRQIITSLSLVSGKYHPVLCRILGALFQCSPEEIDDKSVAEIAIQIKDSLNDEVLHGFFPQLKLLAAKE